MGLDLGDVGDLQNVFPFFLLPYDNTSFYEC